MSSGGEFSHIDEKKQIIQCKLNEICFLGTKKKHTHTHKSRHILRGEKKKKELEVAIFGPVQKDFLMGKNGPNSPIF